MFTNDHKSYLIDFYPIPSAKILNDLKSVVNLNTKRVQTIPALPFFGQFSFIQDWVLGKISNFDYLSSLNAFAGRSFHDAVLYPIFPWILRTYTNSDFGNLEFNNPAGLRDLGSPIALPMKNRKNEERMFFLSPLAPGQVAFYLHSIPPFNKCEVETMFPILESPDGFKSLGPALAAIKGGENCTELPPEFFCCPEAFPPKFDFSPFENAAELVYAHRRALESDAVSQSLHKWVDLIFGVNSTGTEAVQHDNVYNPLLFDGVFKKEPVAIASAVKKCGQMPFQLFSVPHPKKFCTFSAFQSFCQKNFSNSSSGSNALSGSEKDFARCAYQTRQSALKGQISRTITVDGKPPKVSAFIQGFSLSERNPSQSSVISLFTISEMDSLFIFEDLQKLDSPAEGQQSLLEGTYIGRVKSVSKDCNLFVFGNNLIIFDFGKKNVHRYQIQTAGTTSSFTNRGRDSERQPLVWQASTKFEADFISPCGNSIVSASFDGKIEVWSIPSLTCTHLITVSFDYITALATSKKFDIIAVSTKDGSILVYDLKTGRFRFSISPRGCQPIKKLIITCEWGFLVAFQKNIVHLWTINGTFVREAQISKETDTELESPSQSASAIASWKCERGFDFLAFADHREQVHCFEAFYLGVKEIAWNGRSPLRVVGITYSLENRVLMIMTDDGKTGNLHLIPKSLPE